MKKMLLTACVTVMGFSSVANALPFSDTVDQSGSVISNWRAYNYSTGQYEWRSADLIDDSNLGDPYPYVFTHEIDFDPAAAKITSATLDIYHAGNNSTGFLSGEAWLVTDSSEVLIGTLSDSWDGLKGDYWVKDSFTLDSSLFAGVAGNSWTIAFKMKEGTGCWDSFYFDKSVLSGTYDPVPEPATMLLFATGLAGLAAFGRRKVQK